MQRKPREGSRPTHTEGNTKPGKVSAAPNKESTPSRTEHSIEPSKQESGLVLVLCSGIAFAGSLAVYLSTLYPDLPGGDGSEVITAGVTLGCAHPPGYPLFTMLIGAFCSHARCANAMNAFFAALAVALIAFAASKEQSIIVSDKESPLSARVIAPIVSVALFAFSPNVWLYAIGGEVFALNNLANAIMLASVIWFHRKFPQADFAKIKMDSAQKDSWINGLLVRAMLVAFVCALSLTNQHTSVFPVIVYALSVMFRPVSDSRSASFIEKFPLWNARCVLFLGVTVILGMSPYIYLPIIARTRPITCWGSPWSLKNFVRLFLRQDYGTFRLAAEGEGGFINFLKRLYLYFENTSSELLYVGALAALYGLYTLLQSKNNNTKTVGYVTLSAHSFYIIVFCYLANLELNDPLHLGVQLRFFPQAVTIVTFWASIGFARFFANKQNIQWAALLLVGAQIYRHYEKFDMSRNYHFSQYGRAVLSVLPANAMVLCRGDLAINTFRYMQDVDGFRKDLTILDQEIMTWDWFLEMHRETYSHVIFPGTHYHVSQPGSYNLSNFLAHNMARFPGGIYMHGGFKPGDNSYQREYKSIPYGLSEKIVYSDEFVDIEEYVVENEAHMPTRETMPLPNPTKYSAETWENIVSVKYYESKHNQALFLLNDGIHRHSKISFQHAATKFSELLQEQPNPGHWVYRNAGIAYSRLLTYSDNTHEEVKEYLQGVTSTWSKYLKIAPKTETGLQDIRQALESYQPALARYTEQ